MEGFPATAANRYHKELRFFFSLLKRKKEAKKEKSSPTLVLHGNVPHEDYTSTKLPRRGEQAAAAAVTLPFLQLKLGRKVSGDPPLSLLKRKKEAKKEKSSPTLALCGNVSHEDCTRNYHHKFSPTKIPRRGEQAAAAAVTLPFLQLKLGRKVSGDSPQGGVFMPKHGGNIYQNPECSAEWLDFSANINPFGVPETVQHAIQRAVAALVHYPDPAQQKLRQALAEFHGRLPAEIVCGNGGADVIFRIAHALKPQHALLPVPAFSEYEAALREAGCYVTHWNMPFPYQITPALLDELRQGNYDFLVLCNPNNPTGTGIPSALLEQLLHLAAEKHIFVLLDECFCDMAETEPDIVSMIPRLSEFPHVLVLKSLTKLYALAGLRLGYGICSDQKVTAKIAHTGQPWSVNLLAEAAGIAALSAEDYRKMSLEFLQNERWRLFNELGKLGFRMWKPSANYVFFQAEQCPDLDKQLLPYGILLRHCDTYDGLDATYYRAAVRLPEENQYLLHCLRCILGEEGLLWQQNH